MTPSFQMRFHHSHCSMQGWHSQHVLQRSDPNPSVRQALKHSMPYQKGCSQPVRQVPFFLAFLLARDRSLPR